MKNTITGNSLFLFRPELSNASKMSFGSKYRDGQNISVSNIFKRVWVFLCDIFSGESVKTIEQREFRQLYVEHLDDCLEILEDEMEGLEADPNGLQNPTFERIKELLQVKAAIKVSGWIESLQKGKGADKKYLSPEYKQFAERLKRVHNKAKTVLENCTPQTKEESTLKRWMFSTAFQRKFANVFDQKLPFKSEEIPEGAILLSNPKKYLVGSYLKNYSRLTRFDIWLRATIQKIFTGKSIMHTEYSLGDSKIYHQDFVKEEGCCAGCGVIQDRSPKEKNGKMRSKISFAHEVVVLSDDAQKNHPGIEKQVSQELIQIVGKVKTTVWDLIRSIFPKKRPLNYNPKHDYNPNNNHSCSGILSAVFGRYGLDIGKEFGKVAPKVSPWNFEESSLFVPLEDHMVQ